MDLDALKGRWQERGAAAAPGKGEDVDDLRKRVAALRRTAARRDLRETVAAMLVVAIFGATAVVIDRPLARLGAAIIAAGAAFIIIWMRAAGGRNIEPDADLPVAEFLRRERQYLDRQIALLRSTAWWYVAPNLIGLELFFYGSAGSTTFRATLMIGAAMLAVLLVWLNRFAAQAAVVPLRDEVAGVLRELEG